MREDADVEVRAEAARALQRIHDPSVIQELMEACREPDSRTPGIASESEVQVRVEAAHALGQYADPSVVTRLISALDDSSLVVQRAALDSLATLTGQDFGYRASAWTRWRESHAADLFAARGVYEYPVFSRGRLWWEYIPLVPGPPNETPSTPTGMTLGDGS
jgi:HEAT repeat protein